MNWDNLIVAVASGIALGVLGFGARAVLAWWRARKEAEFWPANTRQLLMRMYQHQGRAVLRVKKDRFTPPYMQDTVWVGDEMFQPSDLDYLKYVGLAEAAATGEVLIGNAAMLETAHALTRRGTRWAKRLIRRETRALASIRP